MANYILDTINLRLSQTPTGNTLGYGVAVYKDEEGHEFVAHIVEDGAGFVSFWSAPNGEKHGIGDMSALLNPTILQAAKYGNKGKDTKGNLYGTVATVITTDTGIMISFKAVYLPNESSPENDSFRFIGNPRQSRFSPMKFGIIK